MALIHSFEKSGNVLFKYRGQIPVILFIIAIPVLYVSEMTYLGSPALKLILTVIGVALAVLGEWIRCYTIGTTPEGTSGRNTDKQVAKSLNSTGIYSMLRHPLYLGNYLIWAGIVIFTFNLYFFIIFSLLYWLYYERIMFAEERFLERKFGEDYLTWSLHAPAFIPAFNKYKKTEIPFSFKSVLRREYSSMASTAVSFMFVDLLRQFFYNLANELPMNFNQISVYVAGFFLLAALVLRTIKHHSSYLNEEGRS